MKELTFRIIKSIGMFLFLILFGVFVYAITRTQNTERTDLAYSPESGSQDLDTLLSPSSENKPIGFEYQKMTEESANT